METKVGIKDIVLETEIINKKALYFPKYEILVIPELPEEEQEEAIDKAIDKGDNIASLYEYVGDKFTPQNIDKALDKGEKLWPWSLYYLYTYAGDKFTPQQIDRAIDKGEHLWSLYEHVGKNFTPQQIDKAIDKGKDLKYLYQYVGDKLTSQQKKRYKEKIKKKKSSVVAVKMADKTLFENVWKTIKETDDGYTYEDNTEGVGILPFRVKGDKIEYLIRYENNPILHEIVTIITGRRDEEENRQNWWIDTAARELKEEAGIDISGLDDIDFRIIDLGGMYIGKSHKNPDRLMAIDVTGLDQKEPETDGTIFEKMSTNIWVDEDELKTYAIKEPDCYLSTIANKYFLKKEIKGRKQALYFPEYEKWFEDGYIDEYIEQGEDLYKLFEYAKDLMTHEQINNAIDRAIEQGVDLDLLFKFAKDLMTHEQINNAIDKWVEEEEDLNDLRIYMTNEQKELLERKKKQGKKFNSGTIQTGDVPEEVQTIIGEIQKSIPKEKLYYDRDIEGQIENGLMLWHHITLLWGIEDNEEVKNKVKDICQKYKGLEVTLSDIGYWDDEKKNYTIVYWTVVSEDLNKLHEELKKGIPNKDTQEFRPHITIGYLKLGERLPEVAWEGIKIPTWNVDVLELSKPSGEIERVLIKEV